MEKYEMMIDNLTNEVGKLEQNIEDLYYALSRAESNYKSLTMFGTLSEDDNFEYEGKSLEEKIAIAEETISWAKDNLKKLEALLKDKQEELRKVKKAVEEVIHDFIPKKLTPEQFRLFNDLANKAVTRVLE